MKPLLFVPGISFTKAIKKSLKEDFGLQFKTKRELADVATLSSVEMKHGELFLLSPCLGATATQLLLGCLKEEAPSEILQFASAATLEDKNSQIGDRRFALAGSNKPDLEQIVFAKTNYCNSLKVDLDFQESKIHTVSEVLECSKDIQIKAAQTETNNCFEMEFAAVKQYAKAKNIPCLGVFLISDILTEQRITGFRSKQFRSAQRTCAKEIASRVVEKCN